MDVTPVLSLFKVKNFTTAWPVNRVTNQNPVSDLGENLHNSDNFSDSGWMILQTDTPPYTNFDSISCKNFTGYRYRNVKISATSLGYQNDYSHPLSIRVVMCVYVPARFYELEDSF